MLDIGTGTGLLALRAVQLGFRPVVALDHDPLAVLAARRNALHNRFGDALAALRRRGRRPARPGTGLDLILANLHLNPLLELAPWFAQRLRSDGGLIVSGFEPVSAVVRDGWVATTLRHPYEGAGLSTRPRR